MQQRDWNKLASESSSGFEPVPDGTYDVQVETAEAKDASTGKLMFVCRFNIESGPHAGRKVFNNFVVTTDNPNAMGYFFGHMKTLGLGQEFFARNPGDEEVAQALVGKRCRLEVGHREYRGTMRNDVKKVLPASPGAAAAGGSAPSIPGPSATAPPSSPLTQPPVQAPAPAPAPAAVPAAAPEAASSVPKPPTF